MTDMSDPMVFITTEKSFFKGTKYVVNCAEHGRIAKRYLDHEATKIGTDHAIEHIKPVKTLVNQT